MKKILSLLLAVSLAFACVPIVSASNSVTYNNLVFEKNSNGTYTLTNCKIYSGEVYIPEKVKGVEVTAIGKNAFQLKKNITYVSIPDTIITIGQMAFNGCSSLEEVYMGNKVNFIAAKAFIGCSALTYITLKNVTLIGEMAFSGCKALASVSSNKKVTDIGPNAFSNCTSLSELSLGNNIKTIFERAFYNCKSIETFNFPDTLRFIGNSAFQNCTALSEIYFGTGELEIGTYAFENCELLTQVTIPDNVTKIGTKAFSLRQEGEEETPYHLIITCSKNSEALRYAKISNVSAYVTDYDLLITLFGDIDGDEMSTTKDAQYAFEIVSGIEDIALSDYEMFLYDLDTNGIFDTTDVNLMLRKAADIT